MKGIKNIKAIDTQEEVKDAIVRHLRKKKQVVYGARSINAQAPFFPRTTGDWDIYSKSPKKSANELANELDKVAGFDYFFTKPAKHPGTYKVMNRGFDMRKNTKDDQNVADYSKPTEKFEVIEVDGILYRKLDQEVRAKLNSLRDKNQKFRHKKDSGDLQRIRAYLKIKRLLK